MLMVDSACWLIVAGAFPFFRLFCTQSDIRSSKKQSRNSRKIKEDSVGCYCIFRYISHPNGRRVHMLTPQLSPRRWSGCAALWIFLGNCSAPAPPEACLLLAPHLLPFLFLYSLPLFPYVPSLSGLPPPPIFTVWFKIGLVVGESHADFLLL